MAIAIAMPKLGMTMQEGMVVEWAVGIGGVVEKGRTVVVIESEKAQVEIEATDSGVLRHVYVEAGETVPCGSLLAAITASMAEPFDAEAFRLANDRPLAPAEPAGNPPDVSSVRREAASLLASPPRGGAAPATPAARALARSLDVDMAAVVGSGPGGRITREDVDAFAARRARLFGVAAGVSLEVLRHGGGRPVLLLPGFGVGVASLAPQIQALTESGEFEAIGLHPRGVGASDSPMGDVYDVATAAEDAAALTASLSGPVHVVGASLGAAIALEMALRFPERVRSLALVTPFVVASARLLAVVDAWRAVSRRAGSDVLARTLLPWLFSERTLADAPLRERMRRGLSAAVSVVPPDALDRWARGIASWSGARAASVSELRVATLVIAAGADLLTPDSKALGLAIPGATLCMLEDVGHAAASEAADAVCAALLPHLRGA
ncbi:MAG: alpha/beta fold hydrolase [Deltaproteobacteria bacterium]|nr:alpha/beta fold hydrolase [Deltaproteobacteria bacterium]